MVVLSEIASRALSPAVNDPGTAIDIISTGVRTLKPWVSRENKKDEVKYPRIHVPALQTSSMFEDIFNGVIRDGAGTIEVGVCLQKAFLSIYKLGDDEAKEEAAKLSKYALSNAKEKLVLKEEVNKLEQLASPIG